MLRYTVRTLAFVVALAGCSSSRTKSAVEAPKPESPEFRTEEQKLSACLDLRDHIVDLFADAYVAQEGLTMDPVEKEAFRKGWATELARQGTLDRFERSCFSGVTVPKYECGMQSQTTGGLVACMKLTAR